MITSPTLLDWSHFSVEPAELPGIAENREVFRVLLGLTAPTNSVHSNKILHGANVCFSEHAIAQPCTVDTQLVKHFKL